MIENINQTKPASLKTSIKPNLKKLIIQLH